MNEFNCGICQKEAYPWDELQRLLVCRVKHSTESSSLFFTLDSDVGPSSVFSKQQFGDKPVLFHEVNINNCLPHHFLSDTTVVNGHRSCRCASSNVSVFDSEH